MGPAGLGSRSDPMGQEINLLLISEDGINHYTVIKSSSRLLRSSNTKHKCKQHLCINCLQGFTQESSSDQHRVYCEDNESVRVEMPKHCSTVEFKDGQNQFKVPLIMYTDFESILEPMGPQVPGSLSDPIESPNPNPNQPYINEVNQHTPSGWCVYSKFAYGDVDNPLRLYRGKDCIETFVITSKEKHIDCITCFLSYLWILLLKSNGRNIRKQPSVTFVTNHLHLEILR